MPRLTITFILEENRNNAVQWYQKKSKFQLIIIDLKHKQK